MIIYVNFDTQSNSDVPLRTLELGLAIIGFVKVGNRTRITRIGIQYTGLISTRHFLFSNYGIEVFKNVEPQMLVNQNILHLFVRFNIKGSKLNKEHLRLILFIFLTFSKMYKLEKKKLRTFQLQPIPKDPL